VDAVGVGLAVEMDISWSLILNECTIPNMEQSLTLNQKRLGATDVRWFIGIVINEGLLIDCTIANFYVLGFLSLSLS
jgi:hypothetical protein